VKINVKTGGLLYEYLPPERTANRVTLEVEDAATPAQIMQDLGFPADGSYLVIVNGELVPAEQRGRMQLAEGDQLSINPPLKGG
jgi:sulfur carrier protein ThiS